MTSSCPKRRRAKRTCALMAERTRFVAQRGDEQRDLPKPGRRRGDRLRRRLDAHRRISDTVHISLLVGNNCVLPYQGGIFLRSFATSTLRRKYLHDLCPQRLSLIRPFERLGHRVVILVDERSEERRVGK